MCVITRMIILWVGLRALICCYDHLCIELVVTGQVDVYYRHKYNSYYYATVIVYTAINYSGQTSKHRDCDKIIGQYVPLRTLLIICLSNIISWC